MAPKEQSRGRPTAEALVFGRDSEAWIPNTFNTFFTRMLLDAGVAHMRLHDLRHTFASRGFRPGLDLMRISNALGYSAILITAGVYAHVTDSQMRDAAHRINNPVMSASVALRRVAMR